jgi:hypothetical protein
MIAIETAKQIAELAADNIPKSIHTSVPAILRRLDETKELVRKERMKRVRSSRGARTPPKLVNAIESPRSVERRIIRRPKPARRMKRLFSTTTTCASSSRSISVPVVVDAHEQETTSDLEYSCDEPAIKAERLNPLKATERARAVLAALKLKPARP